MKISLFKQINDGEMLPPFYGIAWYNHTSHAAVCLPMPINLVAAVLYAVLIFLKQGWRSVYIDPRMAFNDGMRLAWRNQIKNLNVEPGDVIVLHTAEQLDMQQLMTLRPLLPPHVALVNLKAPDTVTNLSEEELAECGLRRMTDGEKEERYMRRCLETMAGDVGH